MSARFHVYFSGMAERSTARAGAARAKHRAAWRNEACIGRSLQGENGEWQRATFGAGPGLRPSLPPRRIPAAKGPGWSGLACRLPSARHAKGPLRRTAPNFSGETNTGPGRLLEPGEKVHEAGQ